MENLVSAKQLRDLGFAVPENIPDCATVPVGSWDMKVSGSKFDERTQTLNMEMSVTFNQPFSWIDLDVIVTKENHD